MIKKVVISPENSSKATAFFSDLKAKKDEARKKLDAKFEKFKEFATKKGIAQ